MGASPSAWGTGKDALPPSITPLGQAPKTWQDSTSDTGAVVSVGDAPAPALVDNDSKTEVALTGPVSLTLTEARPVAMYSLTSGATPASAPKAWRLEGSDDGSTWTQLDRRTGQTFAFASYTKSFSVATPKPFKHYRLVLDAPGTLAEVEFLGTLKGVEPGAHPSDQTLRARPTTTPSQKIDRNYG